MQHNGIAYLGLFGSHARGEASKNSDVDLLVDHLPDSPINSLFDHMGVEELLEELLQQKVDLVTKQSIHPYIKKYVYRDLKALYERY